jgi:hypothetical protein
LSSDGLSVLLQVLGARKKGRHWSAVCPAHNDHTPSLDITIGNKGLPVVTCRVCGPDRQREVLAAVEAAGVPRWVWKAEYEPGGPDDKPQVVTSARYEARDWNGTLVATQTAPTSAGARSGFGGSATVRTAWTGCTRTTCRCGAPSCCASTRATAWS